MYLPGQLASRQFPTQIHVSPSQIIFFPCQMNFKAQEAMENPKIPCFTIQDNPSLSNFSERRRKNILNEKMNNNYFKNFYANLALNLVNVLPIPQINLNRIQFWLTIKDF